LSDALQKFLDLVGRGEWHALSLFLTTFVLEDAALLMAIAWIEQSKLSFLEASAAVFAGIFVGDVGLYFAGAFARGALARRDWPKLETFRRRIRDSRRADALLVASRALPGSRLPLYLAAGYFAYPLRRFVLITFVSVFLWTLLFLGLGRGISELWTGQLWGLLALLVLVGYVARNFFSRLMDPWKRKALWHAWRRWTRFEFWPAWLFYVPIAFYVAYLAVKYRSLRYPLYANPDLRNGGLVGESKWDFLKFLRPERPWSLRAVPIHADADWRGLLLGSGLTYPMIFKPDVGQRGYGVRLIRDEEEAAKYLSHTKAAVIAQQYCAWGVEAGIFYHRFPDQPAGSIPSVTRKEFPWVTGDGRTKLGDLIVGDLRARIIADTYFARFEEELDRVPANGERVPLALAGNHCQGAIFWNGQDLVTPELLSSIDRLAHEVPNFYFGRIDVRARSLEDLKLGKNFVVIEINGSGSEMTHIWDANTSLFSAYRTLCHQWKLLFQTGEKVHAMGLAPATKNLRNLAADIRALFRRDRSLTIAS
jgi:membrane protein DedA with SNARE-associated domain